MVCQHDQFVVIWPVIVLTGGRPGSLEVVSWPINMFVSSIMCLGSLSGFCCPFSYLPQTLSKPFIYTTSLYPCICRSVITEASLFEPDGLILKTDYHWLWFCPFPIGDVMYWNTLTFARPLDRKQCRPSIHCSVVQTVTTFTSFSKSLQ